MTTTTPGASAPAVFPRIPRPVRTGIAAAADGCVLPADFKPLDLDDGKAVRHG